MAGRLLCTNASAKGRLRMDRPHTEPLFNNDDEDERTKHHSNDDNGYRNMTC